MLCSDDRPAPDTDDTLHSLKEKHPPATTDRRVPCDPADNARFIPLQVSPDDIDRTLRTFPLGSSGGPDGLTPQHIRDLLLGAPDDQLRKDITDLVNILLSGDLLLAVREVIFGGRLIALEKKEGGVRPICIGYTWRRLTAKCANRAVIAERSEELRPFQVGVGVSGGAEAIVHAARRLVTHLPDNHVIVKLDFTNAFNTVRRDLILDTVAEKIPQLYRFVHATYSCEAKLAYGSHTILSREGTQQGDPIAALEFCEAIQKLLLQLQANTRFGYMDDLTLSGEMQTVAADVDQIVAAAVSTGLRLNETKCEIIAKDFKSIDKISTFKNFKQVEPQDMTLLGAAVTNGPASERALQSKVDNLQRAVDRLALLQAHDALSLLRNSMAMPKLLYILRTSPCFDSSLLSQFDAVLRQGLCNILNIQLSDDQWTQASLPIYDGGLGIRSASMLAPSAFLASAAASRLLQNEMLPLSVRDIADEDRTMALASWLNKAQLPAPPEQQQHLQKTWDRIMSSNSLSGLAARLTSPVDQARLLAVSAEHAGEWLKAPPITSVGLRLSNEMIRVAVGFRLGARTCEPHSCPCGKMVEADGLHGLSCRRSGPRHQRHAELNDIIWRSVKKAQIPAVKEPIGLVRSNGKRPDGATLVPWSRGKPLAWDVTVPDTYAQSHINETARSSGAAANRAAVLKTTKYANLSPTHIFVPVAIETGGSWNQQAVEFVQDLGKRISAVTKEPLETQYLFQRLSIAIQRGNAISFRSTFNFE
jgi:hypothetical protein